MQALSLHKVYNNYSRMKKISLVLLLMTCSFGVFAQSSQVAVNLKKHVEYLSSDALQGRKAGTAGERLAAGYLYDRLVDAGVTMLTDKGGQDFSIAAANDTVRSLNIVGIVEGYDPKLRDEYIVVGAHIDHIGTHTVTINGKPSVQIYPGADDDASGVAAMIDIAERVSQCKFMFPRSIIFVGFGAQEQGMAGSWYFVNRAFEGIGRVKAMVNLDMLGRGNDENPFRIFSQASVKDLTSIMDAVKDEPIVQQPSILYEDVFPSDHLPFYNQHIPIVLFTTGMTREYHTVRDLPKFILYDNLESNCNYIFYFLKTLSNQTDIFPSLTASKGAVAEQEVIYSFADCDKRPQFFHSDEKHFLDSWVYKYVKYPKASIANGIQGTVWVEFIIEKDGSVTNVKVSRGVDDDLDNEAVKAVSVSPKWIPGQVKGKNVRTKIVIPVEFRLK